MVLHAFVTIRRLQPSIFFLNILNAIVGGVRPVITAIVSGLIITELAKTVTGDAEAARLIWLLIIAAGVRIVSYVISTVQNTLTYAKRELIDFSLRLEVLQYRSQLPLDQLELPATKDDLERAEKGITQIVWVFRSLSDLLMGIITIAGTLITIFSTTPWLAAIMLPIPLLTIQLRLANYKLWREWWESARAHRVRSNSISSMFASTSNVMEIRLMSLTKSLLELWRQESKKSVDIRINQETKGMKLSIFTNFLETLAGVAIDIWLAFKVVAGTITVGLFEQTRQLVSTYISGMAQISGAISDIATDSYEINDHRQFVQKNASVSTPEHGPKAFPRTIQLNNVHYTYPQGTVPALSGVSTSLPTNKHIAIVGENGAGKSTFLKILLGFYQPQEGDIYFDEHNIKDTSLDTFYKQTAVLMQDFAPFDFLTF